MAPITEFDMPAAPPPSRVRSTEHQRFQPTVSYPQPPMAMLHAPCPYHSRPSSVISSSVFKPARRAATRMI